MRALVFNGSEWSRSVEVSGTYMAEALTTVFGGPLTQYKSALYPDVVAWTLRGGVHCPVGYALLESLGFLPAGFSQEDQRGSVIFTSRTPELLDVVDLMAWRMQAFGRSRPNCAGYMRELLHRAQAET